MNQGLYHRTLAVAALDMEGYSSLMEDNELETHVMSSRALDRADKLVHSVGGWCLQRSTGDGQLYAFETSASAVTAMVAFQSAMIPGPYRLSNNERILFRVGIHLGPVLIDDIYTVGNTINQTARLQSASEPGSILISDKVYNQLTESSRQRFRLIAPPAMKNMRSSIRTYRWQAEPQRLDKTDSLSIINRKFPSVALVPVRNKSNSRQTNRKVVSSTEWLSLHLSSFDDLTLYPSARLRDISKDMRAFNRLCRLEGVSYVIELSSEPHYSASQRIMCRLLDVNSGQLLIKSQLTLPDPENPAQANSVAQIATRLWSTIQTSQLRRTPLGPSNGHTSSFYIGRRLVRSGYPNLTFKGAKLLLGIVHDNPSHSLARIELAHAFQLIWRYDENGSHAHLLQKAVDILRNVLLVDPEHSSAQRELGYAMLFQKRNEEALRMMQSATRKNPLDTLALSNLAEGHAFSGDAARAIKLINRSLSLDDKHYLDWRLWALADAHFVQRNYSDVVSTVRQMSDQTEGLRLRAASEALLGNFPAAKQSTFRILENTPNFSVTRWRTKQPDSDIDEIDHYCDAMVQAGLPI